LKILLLRIPLENHESSSIIYFENVVFETPRTMAA